MSTYHLHARLFEGTLETPTRNDLQTAESDDFDELVQLAEALLGEGFAVWIYEHGPTRLVGGDGAYRVVRDLRPGRRRPTGPSSPARAAR